jgi:hypothetical protein
MNERKRAISSNAQDANRPCSKKELKNMNNKVVKLSNKIQSVVPYVKPIVSLAVNLVY